MGVRGSVGARRWRGDAVHGAARGEHKLGDYVLAGAVEAYHRAVRADIPGKRLLVFNIESDPPEWLCTSWGCPATIPGTGGGRTPRSERWGHTMAGLLRSGSSGRCRTGSSFR